MSGILIQAEALLGPAVRVHPHRGWAEFWCPFHPDAARQGRRGRPNFGVSLVDGRWKCLRCGRSGPSLAALARELGKEIPDRRAEAPREEKRPVPPPVARLEEALAAARWALWNAAEAQGAREYLARRGISPAVASAYGLGYGLAFPRVSRETLEAARAAGLVRRDGPWGWAGGILFPDPPVGRRAIQARLLRPGASLKYQTWGRLERPYGAWRVRPATRLVIAAEGVFDALALAGALEAEGLFPEAVAVATWGASPSRPVLEWLRDWRGELWLIPDGDEAGREWARRIGRARQGRPTTVILPPDGLDPDEAVRAGWRPW